MGAFVALDDERSREYLLSMESVVGALAEGGFSPRLVSFSALDRYCGLRPSPYRRLESDADLASLARLFPDLRFPGPALADAATESEEQTREKVVWYFRCAGDDTPSGSFPILDFAWDAVSASYIDPGNLYPIVRVLRDGPNRGVAPWWETVSGATDRYRGAADAAIILSRYRGATPVQEEESSDLLETIAKHLDRLRLDVAPTIEEQRTLLTMILVSRRPDLGLRLLKRIGFLDEFWPELAAMDEIDHSKEFHPEGNAWIHTLETFRYRKIADLGLSISLLLHDVGKPLAEASGGRRFDRHAELGAAAARSFLKRLDFESQLIEDVFFLVRNHMMPAALPRLPLTKTQEVLESPIFPLLLELYRCDEASSFKGLEGFYESCAAYRAYLKHVKNPYRSADGKKLMRRLFEH